MATPNSSKNQLVTLTELAGHLGKSSQVISNWRRRYKDFPQPVIEDSESPLYDLTAVENWQSARMVDRSALRSETNNFSSEYYPAILLQLAFKKVGASSGSSYEDALSVMAKMPPRIVEIIESISKSLPVPMADLWTRIRTFAGPDQVQAMHRELYGTINSKSIMSGTVSNLELIELIKSIHNDQGNPREIYDPAAGLSHGLLNFNYSRSTRLYGQEIHQATADLAELLAWITDQELTIKVGDTLKEDLFLGQKADLVICEAPFGMRADAYLRQKNWSFGNIGINADFAWLQTVVDHIAETGRGYMLMTSGALGRKFPEEEQIRRKLVSLDCLEAVIALPPISTATRLPVSLVVLRAPGTRPSVDGALMIDISDQKGWNFKSVSEVTNYLKDFRLGKEVNIPGVACIAKTKDLMVDQASWVPALYLARAFSNKSHRTLEISRSTELHRIEENLLKMQVNVREISETASVIEFSNEQTTLGDLRAKGLISFHPGTRRLNPGLGNPFHEISEAETIEVITASDIRSPGILKATRSLLEEELPNPTISKPNDILVARVGELTAKVDTEGGHVILAPVQIIRVTKAVDPNVIVSALNSSLARKLSQGSGIGRVEIEHIPLPAQASRKDEKLAELMMRLTVLRHTSDEISHLVAELQRKVNETISNSYLGDE